MKRIVRILEACLLAVTLVACDNNDYSSLFDRMDDLEGRVLKLEEICKTQSSDLTTLQTLVEANQNSDYITSVMPIVNGNDTIGYAFTFKLGDPVVVYNGKDGANAVGSTLSVRQDSDGLYYWTVDGEWLTDENGAKQRVTGDDGKNGVTPRMEIRDGYWYVSLDNGTTWTECGKATGENGGQGHSLFTTVSCDGSYMYITLVDGTVITISYKDESILGQWLSVDGAELLDITISRGGIVTYANTVNTTLKTAVSYKQYLVTMEGFVVTGTTGTIPTAETIVWENLTSTTATIGGKQYNRVSDYTITYPSIVGQWVSADGALLLDIKVCSADSITVATYANSAAKQRTYQYPISSISDVLFSEGSIVTETSKREISCETGKTYIVSAETVFGWENVSLTTVTINGEVYSRLANNVVIPKWFSIYHKWKATGSVDYSGMTINATANFDFVTYPTNDASTQRQFYCVAKGTALGGFVSITADPMGPWNMTVTYAANTRLAGDILVTNCGYSYTIPYVNKTVSFDQLSCKFSSLLEKSVYLETQMFNREFNATASRTD